MDLSSNYVFNISQNSTLSVTVTTVTLFDTAKSKTFRAFYFYNFVFSIPCTIFSCPYSIDNRLYAAKKICIMIACHTYCPPFAETEPIKQRTCYWIVNYTDLSKNWWFVPRWKWIRHELIFLKSDVNCNYICISLFQNWRVCVMYITSTVPIDPINLPSSIFCIYHDCNEVSM